MELQSSGDQQWGVSRLPADFAAQASLVCVGCSVAYSICAGNINLGFLAAGASIIRFSSLITLQIGRKSKV